MGSPSNWQGVGPKNSCTKKPIEAQGNVCYILRETNKERNRR